MRSIFNHQGLVNKNTLLGIIVFLLLLGFSLKSQAQSPEIGTDVTKLENSMKLQVNNSDLAILIPKVAADEITAFTDLSYDQMVYVEDRESGFYQFKQGEWIKISIREALNKVKDNIELSAPSFDNIIIDGSVASNRNMLDYNGHIKELNEMFNLQNGNDNFAVNVND
ncbi:hypothetical protein GCM10027429_25120 [Marivirga atlantica]|jgi:hypothetical protein|uniref:Uncharacterized protein n=1 Tax=Marivirga atlantica TaxID=1548457 RepID=A0A937DFD4_9BACT|nr:hypothetical protein [Marivirga atlantica]MBL0766112.1 hypothetical protein [Marivirga atlantica]